MRAHAVHSVGLGYFYAMCKSPGWAIYSVGKSKVNIILVLFFCHFIWVKVIISQSCLRMRIKLLFLDSC